MTMDSTDCQMQPKVQVHVAWSNSQTKSPR